MTPITLKPYLLPAGDSLRTMVNKSGNKSVRGLTATGAEKGGDSGDFCTANQSNHPFPVIPRSLTMHVLKFFL